MDAKTLAKLISVLAIGASIVPGLLYFAGAVGHELVKVLALVGTFAWFLSAPFWLDRKPAIDAREVEI